MPRPRKQTPLSPAMERLIAEAAVGKGVLDVVKASGLLTPRRRRRTKAEMIDARRDANGKERPRRRRSIERPVRTRPVLQREDARSEED